MFLKIGTSFILLLLLFLNLISDCVTAAFSESVAQGTDTVSQLWLARLQDRQQVIRQHIAMRVFFTMVYASYS